MKSKCALTQEIKSLLVARRIKLGWSFRRMAEYFGIEVSTYRNWENGRTTYIQSDKQQRLVQSFIHGDSPIIYGDGAEVVSAHEPEALENCLALVSKIFTLLSADRELLDGYSHALKGSLAQIMVRYVEADQVLQEETLRE